MKPQLAVSRSEAFEATAETCPHCSIPAANVQGLVACPECDWITR